ncbi:GIY-YIG nuclease family protein [Ohtaekwangia sp.]|uniref:GIY-YIG nuclease family protein n=1 Tax=Ohtaekwangia sp. TaxID=2066019 RepID=UPI003FA556DB
MCSVYILESEEGKWYYGSSENVEQRVKDHNTNRADIRDLKVHGSLSSAETLIIKLKP